jgi:hypothetical protein
MTKGWITVDGHNNISVNPIILLDPMFRTQQHRRQEIIGVQQNSSIKPSKFIDSAFISKEFVLTARV